MLASATKSNALQHAMVLWDEVVGDVAKEFPHVELRKYHVDALCARMVTHPQTLDVIVASNLFGDILTDIGRRSRAAWRGARGEHQPGRDDAVDVRADSWLGARHRGQRHRKSDRGDLGGRDDDRSSRRALGARIASCRRSKASSPTSVSRLPISAARRQRAEMVKAVKGAMSSVRQPA
jgi:hypothetical protein